MATEVATAKGHDAHDAHDEHHPTPRFYIQIALVLAILTAMEFSTYFVEFGSFALPLLLVLMVIKFALIVGFFMHLKFDTQLYSRLMIVGLVGAMALYVVVIAALGEVPAGTG